VSSGTITADGTATVGVQVTKLNQSTAGTVYGVYVDQGAALSAATNAYGVYGNAQVIPGGGSGTGSFYGVYGNASFGANSYGVYGNANNGGSGTNYGVYGNASGAPINFAGYFNGGVRVGDDASATCDATHRGEIKQTQGPSGSTDYMQQCMKRANDTYGWVAMASGDAIFSNGAGGYYWYNGSAEDTQGHAKAACESVYGVGNCSSGSCGSFYYYYKTTDLSCNCAKPTGSYEFIYANIGYTTVGQDYAGQSSDVTENSAFVRRKGSNTCDVNSWQLTANLGPSRAPSLAALPSQCNSYANLSDTTRNITFPTGTPGCDSGLTAGWYRFTAVGNNMIPTTPPAQNVCNTSATGWMSGGLPAYGQTNSVTACYNWLSNTCNWSNAMQVTNCGSYYVYFLNPSPACSLRYCTTVAP
jgi:hypothetical protein